MKIPHRRAARAAAALVNALQGTHHAAIIAGGLRRAEASVKDIDLVVLPIIQATGFNLLDEPDQMVNLHWNRIHTLRNLGQLRPRTGDSGRTQFGERFHTIWWDHDGETFPVDIHAVLPPAQLGLITAIRTGPADFSQFLVAPKAKGGALPNGWVSRNGCLWDGNKPIVTPTEADLFDALGLPFIDARDRATFITAHRARYAYPL